MRICKMNYLRRLNLGNYEHKEFSAEAVLDETECSTTAAANLRAFVDGELTGKPAVEEKKEAAKAVQKVVVEEKKEKKAPAPVIAEKKAEAPAPTVIEEKKDEPAAIVVEKKEADAPAPTAVAEKKAKKAPAGADIPYDRTNDTHKKAFQEYLFATYGTDLEVKKKGGNFSRSYEGQPLLNSAGVVCDAFKEAIAKAMA